MCSFSWLWRWWWNQTGPVLKPWLRTTWASVFNQGQHQTWLHSSTFMWDQEVAWKTPLLVLSSYRTRGCPTPTPVQSTTPICRSHLNPNLLFSLRQKGVMSCDITVRSQWNQVILILWRYFREGTPASLFAANVTVDLFFPKWVRIIKHLYQVR